MFPFGVRQDLGASTFNPNTRIRTYGLTFLLTCANHPKYPVYGEYCDTRISDRSAQRRQSPSVLEYKQNSYSAPLLDHLGFHVSYYSYNSPCDHFAAVPNIAEISGSGCKLLSHLRPCRYLIP